MCKKVFKKMLIIIIASIILASFCMFSKQNNILIEQDYTNLGKMEYMNFSSNNIVDSGIDYTEITDKIDNPERGFYRPSYLKCNISGSTNILNPTNHLVHLRVDLKDFGKNSNGEPITQNVLDSLNKTFDNIRKNGGTAILRFAYDYDGEVLNGSYIEYEPEIDKIVNHVYQLEPIFRNNEDVIASVESGFFGPWGEQHSTKITKDSENFKKLLDALLEVVPESRVISVRTPKMFANYVGINIADIDTYIAVKGTNAYRVGLYNDGYLGNSTDLGTYSNRAKEIKWLKTQAKHTLFGGEVVANYSTDGTIYNSIEYISKEMYDTHTSYLNIEWNNLVIDGWKTTMYKGADQVYNDKSAFTYVENHLGYRFVIRDSKLSETVSKGNEFNLQAKIENVGAGNIINEKEINILFVKDNKIKYTEKLDLDVRDWKSRPSWNEQSISAININVTMPEELESGNYQVYLKVSSPNDTHINRAIRFANANIWSSVLGANYMGVFEVKEAKNIEEIVNNIYEIEVADGTSYIRNMREETSVETIKTELNLSGNYIIEIVDIKGEILTDIQNIGTGSVIKIKNQTEDILKTYKVIVKGDITGEGTVNIFDIVKLINYVFDREEEFEWDESIKRAGKVTTTSGEPRLFDIQRLISYYFDGVEWSI